MRVLENEQGNQGFLSKPQILENIIPLVDQLSL